MSTSTSEARSRRSLTLRLARWTGRSAVPLAFLANLGSYVLSLWVLAGTQVVHLGQTEAWRQVTVVILISVQAFWLVWLHRQPVATVIGSIVLWQLAVLAGGHEPLALVPGLLYTLFVFSADQSGRARVLVTLGAVPTSTALLLGTYTWYAPATAPPWDTPAVLATWTLTAVMTIGLPVLAGGWYAQLRDRAERIAELAHRATSGEAVRTADAVAAERRILAQELHDTSSSHLAALLALGAAAHSGTTEGAQNHARLIAQMRDEGERLYVGFERMLNSLRAEDRTVTDHHQPGFRSGQHTVCDITDLVSEHRRTTGVPVTLTHEPDLNEIDLRLGPMRSHIVYRVVQEALSNTRKHAPGTAVGIVIEDDGDALMFRIENDAAPAVAGASAARTGPTLSLGYGLEGMRDRLVAAGGRVRTGPRQQGGWSVNALLPHPLHQPRTAPRREVAGPHPEEAFS